MKEYIQLVPVVEIIEDKVIIRCFHKGKEISTYILKKSDFE